MQCKSFRNAVIVLRPQEHCKCDEKSAADGPQENTVPGQVDDVGCDPAADAGTVRLLCDGLGGIRKDEGEEECTEEITDSREEDESTHILERFAAALEQGDGEPHWVSGESVRVC